jgi:uncharacterized protein (TIGR03435 family)
MIRAVSYRRPPVFYRAATVKERYSKVLLALVTGCAAVCGVTSLYAQSPAFEVAAIRLSNDPPFMVLGPGLRNGHLTASKVTPRRMLAVAFGMTEPRIIGPDWLDKNRFDIAGKSPEGTSDSDLQPMLQQLLKDRFKLEVHREAREMPVYDLEVAKGGVKMAVYPAVERPIEDPVGHGFPMSRGTSTTSQLADMMTFFVNRPVIDKTGLTERYNYVLSFSPMTPQSGDNVAEFAPPDFFTAVQKQLGLKLEPAKDIMDVVVVDHMEQMPTEN